MQILNAILNNTGWRHHPIVKMWRGYEDALILYMNTAIDVWVSKGYNNTMIKKDIKSRIVYPSWIGDEEFHKSHRSNLLRKNKEYYSKFGWTESDDLPYKWVV